MRQLASGQSRQTLFTTRCCSADHNRSLRDLAPRPSTTDHCASQVGTAIWYGKHSSSGDANRNYFSDPQPPLAPTILDQPTTRKAMSSCPAERRLGVVVVFNWSNHQQDLRRGTSRHRPLKMDEKVPTRRTIPSTNDFILTARKDEIVV